MSVSELYNLYNDGASSHGFIALLSVVYISFIAFILILFIASLSRSLGYESCFLSIKSACKRILCS